MSVYVTYVYIDTTYYISAVQKNNSLENIKCHCLSNKPPEQCSESFVISSRWLVEIGIPIMGDTNPQIHQVV